MVVALATSLPEMVTSLAAVRLGAYDLAVGNLFGSNAFNMMLVLPTDIAYSKGALLASVGPIQTIAGLLAIVLMSIGIMGSSSAKKSDGTCWSPTASFWQSFTLLVYLYCFSRASPSKPTQSLRPTFSSRKHDCPLSAQHIDSTSFFGAKTSRIKIRIPKLEISNKLKHSNPKRDWLEFYVI